MEPRARDSAFDLTGLDCPAVVAGGIFLLCTELLILMGPSQRRGSPLDFLSNLVALANFMRLSLLKGARAASSSATRQEIRVREMAKKYALTH
jgi:hypothetical protein